jgi:hypothetical protein
LPQQDVNFGRFDAEMLSDLRRTEAYARLRSKRGAIDRPPRPFLERPQQKTFQRFPPGRIARTRRLDDDDEKGMASDAGGS